VPSRCSVVLPVLGRVVRRMVNPPLHSSQQRRRYNSRILASTVARQIAARYGRRMKQTTQGARTLKAWFDSGKSGRREFADACDVSRQTVYKWECGDVRPSTVQQHRIAHLTGDTVRVVDWLTEQERVEVAR